MNEEYENGRSRGIAETQELFLSLLGYVLQQHHELTVLFYSKNGVSMIVASWHTEEFTFKKVVEAIERRIYSDGVVHGEEQAKEEIRDRLGL